VFTNRKEALSNDFFVNLLKTGMTMKWEAQDDGAVVASDRKNGERKWSGARVELIFGSNSQLRALSEAYAADDAAPAFVDAFVAAWSKVMNLDRFDLACVRRAGSRRPILGIRPAREYSIGSASTMRNTATWRRSRPKCARNWRGGAGVKRLGNRVGEVAAPARRCLGLSRIEYSVPGIPTNSVPVTTKMPIRNLRDAAGRHQSRSSCR